MKLAGISCVKFYGGRGLPYQEFDLFLTWKRVWNPGSRYLSPVIPLHASLNLVWTSSWKLASRNFCGLTKWSSSWCCCLMQAWGLGLALMRMSLGPPAAPGSASCLRPACVSACPLQPDQTQTEPMHHDVAALFQFPAPGVSSSAERWRVKDSHEEFIHSHLLETWLPTSFLQVGWMTTLKNTWIIRYYSLFGCFLVRFLKLKQAAPRLSPRGFHRCPRTRL